MLNVTVLRGLNQTVEEVDSSEVSAADSQHILGQRLAAALWQGDIGDLQRDEAWDDVNGHPNVTDVCDPVGGIEDESVTGFVWLCLHVLDVPTVDVLLGKCRDGRHFGSNVALFVKTPQEPLRRRDADCEYDLGRQVVFMSDLQQLQKLQKHAEIFACHVNKGFYNFLRFMLMA